MPPFATIVVAIMFALSSRSAAVRAFTSLLPIATSTALTSSQKWVTPVAAYSEATLAKLEGLDAADELKRLSIKLNTPPNQLRKLLTTKLTTVRANDPNCQKAEYLHWLLTAYKTLEPVGNNLKKSQQVRALSTVAVAVPREDDTQNTIFADRQDLHVNSKRAIAEVLQLTDMTEIQAKTFQAASSGRDVLGRARTGTGKTIAFLLPAIERVLQSSNEPLSGRSISILVVSPTRELATQIGTQAEQLTKFHRHMSVQVVFGGTNKQRDESRFTQQLPTILVATPGRLLDHLKSTRIHRQSFAGILAQTSVLVLDETDRLLDMGFRRDIEQIIDCLPKTRQTLLFSATIPPDLKTIMAKTMKSDYIKVDCIHDGEEPTHAQVRQSHIIVPNDRFVSSVVEVLRTTLRNDPQAKIVVFFPTARLVNFYAEVFNEGRVLPKNVLELHSKKTQSYRNRVSDEFRQAKHGVLFTSDVSARGVDYPNVSHVLQFGLPESSDQYIHRLGRTGRGANVKGQGVLVLSEWESDFLRELKAKDIALPIDKDLQDLVDSPIDVESEALVEQVRQRIGNGDKVLAKSASGAYQAFLGYYLGQMKRMGMQRKEYLVDIANDFASLAGLPEPPALDPQMVGKMGLKGVAGVNFQSRGPPVRTDHHDGRQGLAGGRRPSNQGQRR